MSTKSKGTNAERELIHKLWASGYASIRSAGSGSMKYPSPDILAAKDNRILAIECKITKANSKYFEEKEIDDLKKFSGIFGAIPYIAIKFKGEYWFFMIINDLKKTDKCYMVNVELAKKKGFLFDQII
jgi:Holliday junction resolvase|tara:strand:+ start:1657 stop:2040 length:384 start_codon:yes stop_codon:yes gene_type:complete